MRGDWRTGAAAGQRRGRHRARCLVVIGALWLGGCGPKLPEPESDGAKLYATRCVGCHQLWVPNVLTFDMWKMKVDAMQGEMARRGVPPLTDQERSVLLDYLRRHSG